MVWAAFQTSAARAQLDINGGHTRLATADTPWSRQETSGNAIVDGFVAFVYTYAVCANASVALASGLGQRHRSFSCIFTSRQFYVCSSLQSPPHHSAHSNHQFHRPPDGLITQRGHSIKTPSVTPPMCPGTPIERESSVGALAPCGRSLVLGSFSGLQGCPLIKQKGY